MSDEGLFESPAAYEAVRAALEADPRVVALLNALIPLIEEHVDGPLWRRIEFSVWARKAPRDRMRFDAWSLKVGNTPQNDH